MKVVWLPEAEDDRHEAVYYIAEDNPGAAERMDALFGAAVGRLSSFAHLGRPGAIPGTRELIPHPSYRIVYEIGEDTISVLALVHTARQWPPVAE